MILTDAERERITRCLDEHGGVCREVMCDDSLDVLIDSIIRQRAARAWDEGWAAMSEARNLWASDRDAKTQNPYRVHSARGARMSSDHLFVVDGAQVATTGDVA